MKLRFHMDRLQCNDSIHTGSKYYCLLNAVGAIKLKHADSTYLEIVHFYIHFATCISMAISFESDSAWYSKSVTHNSAKVIINNPFATIQSLYVLTCHRTPLLSNIIAMFPRIENITNPLIDLVSILQYMRSGTLYSKSSARCHNHS